MKILHAPVNIANQGWLLSRGQRELGHEADVHAAPTGAFDFPADRTLRFQEGTRAERLTGLYRYLADCIEAGYEVFHFYYHASLLPRAYGIHPYSDLPVLRGLGKRVFFHLMGCDFRLPSLSYDRNPHSMCVKCRSCLDRDKVSLLESAAPHANGLIAAGEHSRLFVGEFGLNMLPIAVDLASLGEGDAQREVPRVVHMPTNRAIKGTDAVLAAVEALRGQGFAFEFDLVEGVPHEEAKRRVREADVLIDQLGSDFHATAAIEAMATGRVVVGGVIDSAAGQYGKATPVVPANAGTLVDVLRGLLPDAERRRSIAEAGWAYARAHHDHLKVAARCVKIYKNPVPPVPEGETAPAIAARLRERSDAHMPAFQATATVEGSVPAAPVRDEPRFPFPEERLENPRLSLPLHERFGQGLEEYVDDKFRLGRRFFRERLRELGITVNGPVLDMGCGPGQWAVTIAESNPETRVVACDRNDFLFSCAAEKKAEMALDNLEVVKADILKMPFEDGEFSTVLCIGVLQLVNVPQAFGQLARVTRPGGRILINVPGLGFYARNMAGALRAKRKDIFQQNLKFVKNTVKGLPGPFTYFGKRRLRAMAGEHGLRLEWVRATGLYPPQEPRFFGLPVNMDALFTKPGGAPGA